MLPHDHPEIFDQYHLIRGVPLDWVTLDPKVTSGKRLSSIAYKPSSGVNGGISVNLKEFIEASGFAAVTYCTTEKWPASLIMNVGALRGASFKVGYDPLEGNLFHCEIWGSDTRAKEKILRGMSTWFVPLDGVEP